MTKLIKGRYEPLEVVGRGGQGEVVRALDHRHRRHVVLKMRTVGSADEREALLSEARTLLTLKPHPGLPFVREDFFVGRRYYIVMDWVEGKGLDSLLREQGDPGLPLSTALRYLAQAADALDRLHAYDPPIVHQDVKPANLILTPEGRVVLVDFGIATPKAARGRPPMGTRGYAAPELAAGPPTPAADIYGLAATAFALLSGSPPEAVRPGSDGIPRALAGAIERTIRKGLSNDPKRRHGSASEFVEELRQWLDASPRTSAGALRATKAEGRPEAEGEAPARRGEPIRLMLVDDHPVWREAVRGVLERDGFGTVVAEASDGPEAIELAPKAKPHVVVMDLHLPSMSGVEITRRVLDACGPVKVLMMSASGEEPDVLEALKAGASGYLLKNSSSAEVADAVRRVFRGEPVFSPSLASLVLQEFRRLATRDPGRRGLVARENDVLKLMAKGDDQREIARKLSVPLSTVRSQVKSIHAKLQVRPAARKKAAAQGRRRLDRDADAKR
jgi:DNA-binding NarL/FixJ family response regulator/tRNA A-37 threonylcarbamoyl transferase component Bud32